MTIEQSQDALIVNARIATFRDAGPYGIRDDADAIAIQGGRIAWIGPAADAPAGAWTDPAGHPGRLIDAEGAWVMPGLIDCHTHLIYAGSRASEFEMRLNGASYEDIARAGGGIVSTVRATRQAGEDGLIAQALPRLRALLREGVTTVEIKSGYGLDRDTELAMLRAARALGASLPVTIRTTFLGAHALPPEYAGRADDYIDFVCTDVLPEAARLGLADAVDVFHESIGFDAAQTERVYRTAASLGLPVKVHAEQLNLCGAAALGARYRALSADHLEHLDEAGARAMAAAGTVAVLLPGAFYFLRDTKVPPIDLLRRHQVPMAVATDCNPGTSPFSSLLLMLNMACTLFRLTPAEALRGVTQAAARALGLQDEIGTVTPGKWADLVFWRVPELAELCYSHGAHRPARILRRGVEQSV
ncbi:imidazolonepropionase [Bordetella genomosp. 8]|uniref:Imidazolonepropionase n=1 Tax=Bordetella genomosp. 8 TaxID=1416806 RepID=A0A1W6YUC4_9BORD|nr:imidazolonepropionase [Bordetella genomosp. 8]ARP84578.1 imidazolonepropionase [Bordetella genomosp. 8]